MTGGGEAVVAHFAGQSPNRQFFKIRLAASEPGARGFPPMEATRRMERNCLSRHITLWRSLKAPSPLESRGALWPR
jgi:hypothetical protein